MARRESRQKRRRRVIRNRIILVIVIVLIVAIVVTLVLAFSGNGNKSPETTTSTTETTTSENGETTTQAAVDPNDKTAPVITGPSNIYVARGSTLAYKSYVTITDDGDPNPKLTIDNSNVDLSQEGTYVVHYKATDSAGNETTKDVNVVVGPPEETNVPEEEIYALADKVLEEIITDDMTDLEKVFAVFFYVRDSFTYVRDDSYMEYKQEAYKFLTTRQDNCYANVCLSKLLLERLGFQSFLIQGKMGEIFGTGDENHYWNMVSIDGGKSWYHYDSAWWNWMHDEYPLCMMTDAFAQKISDRHGGIFIYDKTQYPATPTEDLWTPEEMGFTSKYE